MHAKARVNLLLAIKWKMIAVFRHADLGQQAWGRVALRDKRRSRRQSYRRTLANAAAVLWKAVLNDLELPRRVF